VITSRYTLDAEGRELSEQEKKDAEEIETYQKLQYYQLFDAGSPQG